MALQSENRIAWTYTSDDGTDYRVSAMKAHTDQAKQGGADGSGVDGAKPADLKMRRVTVHNDTYGSRVVPFYVAGAPISIKGEVITLNAAGDARVFTSRGNPLPEGHHIHNVTSQSA